MDRVHKKLHKLAREALQYMTPELWEEHRRNSAFWNAAMSNPDITREDIDRAAERMARAKKRKRRAAARKKKSI